MNDEKDNRQLLDDVLGEAAPAAFRAELLDRTLAHVRRRARNRRVARVAAAVAAVALVASVPFVTFLKSNRPGPAPRLKEPASALAMINSAPLDPAMVLLSDPATVRVVESAPGTVMLVTTDESHGRFRELTDDDLLAMAAGESAVLVRQAPHQAELLVVDAATHVARPAGQ